MTWNGPRTDGWIKIPKLHFFRIAANYGIKFRLPESTFASSLPKGVDKHDILLRIGEVGLLSHYPH